MIISPAQRLQQVSEYYFSAKLREIAQLREAGHHIINLGIGSPDGIPSSEVIDVLNSEVNESGSHGYQSYVGMPELRSSISYFLKSQYDIDMNPNGELLPLIGSKEGIMHISMSFLNSGDLVLVPNPGYPTYASVTNLMQAETVSYELNDQDWSLDFDMLEKLPLDKVKLMWVNFPNMPTGAKGDLAQFARLINLAKEHSFLIVNDNPYSMLFSGKPLSIFQAEGAADVCLELNSLSKSHNMAGWRLGWLAGREDYIQTILKVKSNMDSGMFLPIQMAASEALRAGDDWYTQLRLIYKKRRIIAFSILETLNCTFSLEQGGMFAWGKLPPNISDTKAFVDDILHNAGVFIVPGGIFGSKGSQCVRISLCSSEEVLESAHQRISDYLKHK